VGSDAALSPNVFVATMVQVYVFPFVREPTVIGEVAWEVDWVAPPSLEVQVTVKLVTVSPPLAFGVKPTVTALRSRSTDVIVGASARPAATNELDAVEAALSPTVFVATAVHV
jgi:hypothetical protein